MRQIKRFYKGKNRELWPSEKPQDCSWPLSANVTIPPPNGKVRLALGLTIVENSGLVHSSGHKMLGLM